VKKKAWRVDVRGSSMTKFCPRADDLTCSDDGIFIVDDDLSSGEGASLLPVKLFHGTVELFRSAVQVFRGSAERPPSRIARFLAIDDLHGSADHGLVHWPNV
jgi:hypothetical protein